MLCTRPAGAFENWCARCCSRWGCCGVSALLGAARRLFGPAGCQGRPRGAMPMVQRSLPLARRRLCAECIKLFDCWVLRVAACSQKRAIQ